MDETTRKSVLEIIKKAIDEVVYAEVKQIPERLRINQEEMKKTKAQREQDAHNALFGKHDDEWSYKINLREFEEKPKITSNELEDFQKEMKSHFPGILFDKQTNPGQNGQIVDFPIRNGQKDAFTSGKITIGEESIAFSMSLLNGLKVKSIAESGEIKPFEIKKETKDVFGKLLNLYEELFKEKFNQIINPTDEVGAEEMAPIEPAPPIPAPDAPAISPQAPAGI